jgi:ABC-2 type transport system permease protein
MLVAGLADGIAAAATTGDASRVATLLGAALAPLPAVLVVIGVAALLVGVAPRFAGLAWVLVGWAVLIGVFGGLLRLPEWATKLSPFGWVPAFPGEDLDAVPLVGLSLVAAALLAVALAGFRRRDLAP